MRGFQERYTGDIAFLEYMDVAWLYREGIIYFSLAILYTKYDFPIEESTLSFSSSSFCTLKVSSVAA